MYTYEKQEGNKLRMKISVEPKEWEEMLEESYQKNKGKFNIQGFRKGKAPRRVIEKNYGDTVFMDDAIDEIISKEYYDLLSKNKDLEPVANPEVKIESIGEDGVKITLDVDLKPEIKLGKYTGLSFEKSKAKVSAKQVEEKIKIALESHARFVETDKASKNGDMVTINFTGKLNGTPFEGGAATDYRLELGSHSFIDGFEEQVVGMKAGEEKDINVTFPENYHSEELKGKPAVFTVKVNKVEEKIVPELNDEFVSDTTEFETVDDYKKDIKKNLEIDLDKKTQRELENKIIEEIVKNSEVTIPKSMVEAQLDMFIRDFEMRLGYQGLKLDGYVKYTGTTIEAMRNDKRAQAEESVKTRLALEKIIEENKLEVSSKELDENLKAKADKYKKSLEDYKKSLGERELMYIENDILMDKLFKFLMEKNSII